MTPLDRFALRVALVLTPDSRPLTRWKVMRGAVVRSRQQLTPQQEKRLLRGLGRSQKAMVAIGIAVYAQVRWRPLPTVLFLGVVSYLLWAVAGSVTRMI